MYTLASKCLSSIRLPDSVGSQSQWQTVNYTAGHTPPMYPAEQAAQGLTTQQAQLLQMHSCCPIYCHMEVTLIRRLLFQ